MTYIVVGLFKDHNKAGNAVAELKGIVDAKDISILAKDEKSGKIHVHQIKETGELTEATGGAKGAELGAVAGVIGGISTIMNPAFAAVGVVAAMAVAMGLAGATIGEFTGAFIGAEEEDAFPPERARLYKDRIRAGEVFVSASSDKDKTGELTTIFGKYGATKVHTMQTRD